MERPLIFRGEKEREGGEKRLLTLVGGRRLVTGLAGRSGTSAICGKRPSDLSAHRLPH